MAFTPLAQATTTIDLSLGFSRLEGTETPISCTIDVTDNTNSSYSRSGIIPTDIFNFISGDSLTLLCTPTAGYTFDHWNFVDFIGGTPWESTANPYTGTFSIDTAVYAVFVVHSVSVSINSPAATTYDSGVSINMDATAVGSTLENITFSMLWGGIPVFNYDDDLYTSSFYFDPSDGTYTLVATAYNNVGDSDTKQVTFTIDRPDTTFTITPSHDAHCTINPNTAQTVSQGGQQTFTYSADTGYNISSVLVDGVSVANTGSYTFTNVLTDHTISVSSVPKIRYSDIAVSDTIANKTVTLSISCTSGAYNLSQAVWDTNSSGTWGALTPVSLSGLNGWANSTITWNSTIGQTIGYRCNITDTAGNLNTTGILTFSTKAYYITASNDTYSLLEPLGQVAVCYGGNQQFNFSALGGYTIENVIINGTVSASTTSPYTFTNVQGNQTISVSTGSQIWYVNATSDDGCAVDPSGLLLMIPAGTWANFTFSPLIGYQLAKLYINGSQVTSDTHYEFIPTGNTTIYLTSTKISTGQPASGDGLPTSPPTPTATPESTMPTAEIDRATQNNIILSIGVIALIILVASVISMMFAKNAKKKVRREIKSWNTE